MRPFGWPEGAEQPPARLRGTLGDGPTGQTRPGNHPPGCGALWEMAQLGKRARGTTRQAAGHCGRWPNWANAPGEPPAGLRGTLGDGPTGQTRPGNHPPGCGAVPHAPGEPPARLRGTLGDGPTGQTRSGNRPPGCGAVPPPPPALLPLRRSFAPGAPLLPCPLAGDTIGTQEGVV